MIDPKELRVGEFYHIDRDFRSGGKVKLIRKWTNFCTVEDPDTGATWETMVYRLSELTIKEP